MKKLLIISMLLTGMTVSLFAQNRVWIYNTGKSKTEQLFELSNPGFFRHKFIIALPNSNNVTVYVSDKTSFESLLNMDSVVRAVVKTLELFKDSLQNELTQKKIDYLNDLAGDVKLRIREVAPAGNSFVIGKDGPAMLKIEQDTLNIIGYQVTNRDRTDHAGIYVQLPYRVVFVLNDINKLESIADGTLNGAMQELKKQWDGLKRWKPQENWKTNLNAYYNPAEPKFNRPIKEPYISDKKILEPYVQFGIQNVNNMFTTSAGVGLEILNKVRSAIRLRYQLFWEPYFFFDRTDDKFRMRRNDFVTFQFISINTNYYATPKDRIEFRQNFSVGYLVHRSGNYFKDNTFKVGLPGANFKLLSLHPEMIFNNFFKDFQPGLKLVLDLD